MHPVIAAEILEQAPALHEVAPIVYHHHERYDGTGYVEGLSGEAYRWDPGSCALPTRSWR
jgi:response regulator RpfG family c-di-GMP phosphodiesterase